MRIRTIFVVMLLMVSPAAFAQVSYWFQGFQKQGNAKYAQEYFFKPGTNMVFTFDNQYIYLNSAGGGGGGGNLQLFGDVTSPLTALPNVTATLANVGTAGTYTKVTFNAKGLETAGTAAQLASADFQNQGTTTTLLHGNAAGNPTWSQVNLATDVTGTLPGASVSGVWHLAGDALGAPGSFLGSTDNQPLQFRVNNIDVGSFTTGNSIRLGKGSVASGANSVAIGPQDGLSITTASGSDSTALGLGSTASGDFSFALGAGCQSLGVGSFALGIGAVANSDGSVAIGNTANASGLNAIVIGFNASSVNDGSFVISDGGGGAVSDMVPNQFMAGFFGGAYWTTYANGFTVDDGGAGLRSVIQNGNITADVNIIAKYQMFATNGYREQVQRIATNGVAFCTTNKQTYLLYGTNEIVTLVSAADVPHVIYRFSSTNRYGSFVITNKTGTQTIRDSQSLSYTNNGIGDCAFISDGAHWWGMAVCTQSTSGAGSQTPWLSDINGNNFSLTNAKNVFATNSIGANILWGTNNVYSPQIRSSTAATPRFKLNGSDGSFDFTSVVYGGLSLQYPGGGSTDTLLAFGGFTGFAGENWGNIYVSESGTYYMSFYVAGASSVPRVTLHGNAATRVGSVTIGTDAATSQTGELLVDQPNQTNIFLHSAMARQGFFYCPTNNGIAGALNKTTPLGAFACIMSWGTNTIVTNAATYHILTNNPTFTTTRTNQFRVNTAAGLITNVFDGFYRCTINMSGIAVDAGALIEGDLLLNGVERDEISFQSQFDPGTPRIKGMSATGILYIPAGTQITFQIKSSGANGFTVRRAQVVIGTP